MALYHPGVSISGCTSQSIARVPVYLVLMSITVRGQMCTIRPGNLEVPYGARVYVHVPGLGVWMSRDRPPLSAPPL